MHSRTASGARRLQKKALVLEWPGAAAPGRLSLLPERAWYERNPRREYGLSPCAPERKPDRRFRSKDQGREHWVGREWISIAGQCACARADRAVAKEDD